MSAVDDVGRMLTLVPWLLARPGASIAETAETFGVPQKVVRRDLERLDFCGLPGLGGGDLFEVSIVGDRVVVRMADELRRPLRLNPREALRLILAVEAVAATFGDELPALRSAMAKVRDAAGVEEGVAVELDPEGGRWLVALRGALRDRRRVRLHYRGRTDPAPRDRMVDPWALRVVEGAWYLQGHDEEARGLRTFRLDRVAEVEVLDEALEVTRPEHELPRPRYAPTEDDTEVRLRLRPGSAWLIDAIEPEHVGEAGDGVLEVRFHTDALRWVERLLLAGGAGVEVVAPEELRRAVHDAAEAALRRYGEFASASSGDLSSDASTDGAGSS